MRSRGFFFTLDVAISLLLIMTVSILAFSYFGKLNTGGFDSAVQYGYLQDASTLLVKKGCLQALLCPYGPHDDSCTNEVLLATPASTCMSVSGYSAVSVKQDGTVEAAPSTMLFSIDKPGCSYSGGSVQILYFPFSCDSSQTGSGYYRAAVKAWQKGAR